MGNAKLQGPLEPQRPPDASAHGSQLRQAVFGALLRTEEPSLVWLDVEVQAEGVLLRGVVRTPRERQLALATATQAAWGLPVVDRIAVWSETTSRLYEEG